MNAKGILATLLALIMLILAACAAASKDPATAQSADSDISGMIKLPDGAAELEAKEIEQIKEWVDEDYIRGRFLQSTYNGAQGIDLYYLFIYGYGTSHETAEMDLEAIREFLAQYGRWGHFETTRITEAGMDDILRQYADISFDETMRAHLDGLYYVDVSDCYYSFHGNIIGTDFEPVFGYRQDDTVCLYYKNTTRAQTRFTGYYRVTLQQAGDSYIFRANEFCDDSVGYYEYVFETYEESSSEGVFSSNETITMQSLSEDAGLSGQAQSEAVQNVKGQTGFAETTLADQLTSGISEYGTLVAGELDGTAELYYITVDGTVYKLPLFEQDIEMSDVLFEGGEWVLEYTIEVKTSEDSEAETALSVTDYYGTVLLPSNELYIRTVKSDFIGG